VYALDRFKNQGKLPNIKIFVDSPLSTSATQIVRNHPECFNENLREYIQHDPDPFGFNNLVYVQDAAESKAINDLKEPCIIISASGMCDAGRVKHHLRYSIEDEKNTVLMVGYCSPNTLGAKLMASAKQVRIFGDYFDVKADIEVIHSYSAHADYEELIRFLSCQDPSKVKSIFLVHGEEQAKAIFKTHLQSIGFKNTVIPSAGELFDIE
jgi:metallo-beta-lactamase family protein